MMPTVCAEMSHFVGDLDAELREDAVVQLCSQLTVMAEIGGTAAMKPASYGMFSTRLPPFVPPRTPEEDTAALPEYVNPLTRDPQGTQGFSWTAALALDLVIRDGLSL